MPPAELATSLTVTEADRLLQAEAVVRDYCGWHIAPERTDEEITVNGGGGAVLMLPSLLVTEVSDVVDDGEAIDPAAYVVRDYGVLERLYGCWSTRTIELTLTHGYASVPPAVQAIVQAVAQRGVSNPGSLVRKQVGPFADTYSQVGFNQSIPIALLDAERRVLDHYRIPPRP